MQSVDSKSISKGRGAKTGIRRKAPAPMPPTATRRPRGPGARRDRGGSAETSRLRQHEEPATGALTARRSSTAETSRLRQHEELLRAVIENISICLWAVDRRGVFIYHDGKGLESAGLAPGEYLGSNIFDLYGPESTEGVRRALAGEAHHSFSEAHGVHWETWLMPVQGEDGEVSSVIGFTLDVSQTKRAEQELHAKLQLIGRQQQVIRDLSTPIIEVWEGVLTLPMVGVVDSARTSEVMENLLSRIVETGARYAILDLTGVEVVDTKVASHIISLVSAIRLLGAEGIITGIKPNVAQTIVALGLDLSTMTTHANLRAGLKFCIQRMAKVARPG